MFRHIKFSLLVDLIGAHTSRVSLKSHKLLVRLCSTTFTTGKHMDTHHQLKGQRAQKSENEVYGSVCMSMNTGEPEVRGISDAYPQPGLAHGDDVCSCIRETKRATDNILSKADARNIAHERGLQEAAVLAVASAVDFAEVVELFDAHCHLQLDPLHQHASRAIVLGQQLGVRRMSVCGTSPGSDWQKIEALCAKYPDVVVPSFGLHPWWIARVLNRPAECESVGKVPFVDDGEWSGQLEELLLRYPAAHVGECGLDKAVLKSGVSYELQEQVLRRHLQLAAAHRRALTLHCVSGCWDRLLQILRTGGTMADTMPSAVILHSCNSLPKEMVPRFLQVACPVFFSLSMGGRAGLSERAIEMALQVPTDRLLIETDSPDQLPDSLKRDTQRGTTEVGALGAVAGPCVQYNEPGLLRKHCGDLARNLRVDPATLAAQTAQNARNAYTCS